MELESLEDAGSLARRHKTADRERYAKRRQAKAIANLHEAGLTRRVSTRSIPEEDDMDDVD